LNSNSLDSSTKYIITQASTFLLPDTSSVATGVSLINIRLLPFSTSDFYIAVSYKLNASINKPNKARSSSLNPKQSEILPLNVEVRYNLHKMLFSTQRRKVL